MNVSHNNINQGGLISQVNYNSSQIQQINLGIPDEENEDKSLVQFDVFGDAVSQNHIYASNNQQQIVKRPQNKMNIMNY